MQIANVVVVIASIVVYPTVSYLTFRSLMGWDLRMKAWANQHQVAYLCLGAVVTIAVILLSVAGFYATSPFAGLSHFSSMFLSMMLLIQLQINRRTTSSFVIAWIFAVVLVAAAAAAVLT